MSEKKNQTKIEAWLTAEKQKSADAGLPFFLDLPDHWYEPVTYVCQSGHISHRYLKSEALGREACLVCLDPIYLCPNVTEEFINTTVLTE